MNKIATTVEPEKESDMVRSSGRPGEPGSRWDGQRPASSGAKHHGWPSRLRSYFILSPLIWAYTLILGTISLACSFFYGNGRIQHKFARLWSWMVMKTTLSPVTITGAGGFGHTFDNTKARVYAVTHASALDIPILYVHLPFQFRIIFKSELLAYPFVGWHLRAPGRFGSISRIQRLRLEPSSPR